MNEATMTRRVHFDELTDTITIDGQEFAGAFFDKLLVLGIGTWVRIEQREASSITLYHASDENARTFDAITGRGNVKSKGKKK